MKQYSKRHQIVNKIHRNSEKIKVLLDENIELNRQHLMLSDKNQWYTETEETIGRGKNKETALIGFVHWKEEFKDEDSNESVWINRKTVVRKNGEWLSGY